MGEENIWELYDNLIEGIPPEYRVDDLICGSSKVYVRSGDGSGYSLLLEEASRPVEKINKVPGMSLRELAECIKSWNLVEASIGQAALNAYYNSVTVARGNGIVISDNRYTEDRIYDPFIVYQNAIRNKKVAVVGHFNYLEQLFQPVCDLVILEHIPQSGDYPYSAAEYLLPASDYVFITCGAFIDKSLPRFLKLARGKHIILIGPATPMAPLLSRYGVMNLCGFVIKDGEKARRICAGQEDYRIYSTGQKVNLRFDARSSTSEMTLRQSLN